MAKTLNTLFNKIVNFTCECNNSVMESFKMKGKMYSIKVIFHYQLTNKNHIVLNNNLRTPTHIQPLLGPIQTRDNLG